MKKGLRKSTPALLAASMLITVLAGCAGGGAANEPAPTANDGAETAGTGADASGGEPKAFTKYDPPVTINIARTVTPSVVFKPGETIDDNVHTRWVKDNLGIIMKHSTTAGTYEDLKTKMRLALAGNQDWPDIFVTNDLPLISEMISSGKLMALDDVIANYPNDILRDLYAQNPQIFYPVQQDGKTYGLPIFEEGSGNPPVMYIRQDWLDALGLQAPTTIEEFEQVLDAFTNGDPDGNGQKDTFGLSMSLDKGFMTQMAGADAIIGAYTDHLPKIWTENEAGELVYGSVDPSLKPVLGVLRGWMEKGYIDPEAGILDQTKASEAFVQGKSGIIFGPMWLPMWPLNAVKQNNPNAVYKPYPVPAGPDGNRGFQANPMAASYIVIGKDFKYMDGFNAYMDYMVSAMMGTSEHAKLGFYEGYDYVTHDGVAYFGNMSDTPVPKEKWPREDGSSIEVHKYFSMYGEAKFLPPRRFEEVAKKFAENPDTVPTNPTESDTASWPQEALEAYLIYANDRELGVEQKFTGAPTKTMTTKWELLLKLETESITKILYGREPLDYFDTFVDNWKKNGGEQITKEINEWYAERNP